MLPVFEVSGALAIESVGALLDAVTEAYVGAGYAGVRSVVSRASLDRLSSGETGELLIEVRPSRIGKVVAVRAGQPEEGEQAEGVDRIARDSPVEEGEAIDANAIDRYVARLNRRPGRRVEASLASGDDPSRPSLKYIVHEDKPWLIYGQLENTGTDEIGELRARFGAQHFSLTGADDVASIDYITSGTDSLHAVTGSYERPLGRAGSPLRARAYGSYVEYDASEVGAALETFEGRTASGGLELSWNAVQRGNMFIDVVGGARYDDIMVDNSAVGIEGETPFLTFYGGLRLERDTHAASTEVSLLVRGNLPSVTDEDEVGRLGRFGASDDFVTLELDATQSVFLDAIGDSGRVGAHEVLLRARGQHSFGRRLAPNYVMTVGGLHSVRGYPEAFASGDSALAATAEYRLHVPRLLSPAKKGELFGDEFRFRPERAGGATDWDLVLKTFADVGVTSVVDALSFEDEVTLVSAGVGAELSLKTNVSARVDWGIVLKESEYAGDVVSAGSNRVHFSLLVLY